MGSSVRDASLLLMYLTNLLGSRGSVRPLRSRVTLVVLVPCRFRLPSALAVTSFSSPWTRFFTPQARKWLRYSVDLAA